MSRYAFFSFCTLLVFSLPIPLNASQSFNDAVEDSRTPKNGEDKGSTSNTNEIGDAPSEIFVELLAYLWLHNLEVRYAPYPYCYDGERFLVWESFDDFYSGEFRLRRFSLDSAAVWFDDLGIGNETRIECMFLPFLGIRTENLLLCETKFNPDISGNLRTSMQVPLIQTNPLCCYIDMGAAFWYGDVHPLLNDGGFLLGMEFRSYPFKPLALRLRLEWQLFDDDVDIFNLNLETGFLFGRWEFFAGWKNMSVSNSTRDEPEYTQNGISTGVRLYW